MTVYQAVSKIYHNCLSYVYLAVEQNDQHSMTSLVAVKIHQGIFFLANLMDACVQHLSRIIVCRFSHAREHDIKIGPLMSLL